MPAMLLSAGGGSSIGVEIDPGKKFQKIEYFGASDAWSTQYVGDYWEDLLKEKAARLLFSQKFDGAGNPEGIGLSLWRVNLGGGSLEGDESPIKFPWRGGRGASSTPKAAKSTWPAVQGCGTLWKRRRGMDAKISSSFQIRRPSA